LTVALHHHLSGLAIELERGADGGLQLNVLANKMGDFGEELSLMAIGRYATSRCGVLPAPACISSTGPPAKR
jgi:hypothetical protein